MIKGKWSAQLGSLLVIVALVVIQGREPLHAQSRNDNMGHVTHVAGATAGLMGAGAVLCGVLSPECPAGLAIGGAVLGGIGGTLVFMPNVSEPRGPMPGDLNDGSFGCGLDCQASQSGFDAPTLQQRIGGGDSSGSGCSIWWGCVPAMESGKLTVSTSGAKPSYLVKLPYALPPTHPVRSALGNLVPRPDWRGFVVNEWMAPHYRTVLTRLR